jgi:outer membrane autotransporter protein
VDCARHDKEDGVESEHREELYRLTPWSKRQQGGASVRGNASASAPAANHLCGSRRAARFLASTALAVLPAFSGALLALSVSFTPALAQATGGTGGDSIFTSGKRGGSGGNAGEDGSNGTGEGGGAGGAAGTEAAPDGENGGNGILTASDGTAGGAGGGGGGGFSHSISIDVTTELTGGKGGDGGSGVEVHGGEGFPFETGPGGGGAGGDGVRISAPSSNVTVSAAVTGGQGGKSGSSLSTFDPGAFEGGGGGGGAGLVLQAATGLTINAAVTGGKGGDSASRISGGGGGGGAGVVMEADSPVTINATVAGGSGGAAGANSGSGGAGLVAKAQTDITVSAQGSVLGGDAPTGAGSGGAGVTLSAGGTVVNHGTIKGGRGGEQAPSAVPDKPGVGGAGSGGAPGTNPSTPGSGVGGVGIAGLVGGVTIINAGTIEGGTPRTVTSDGQPSPHYTVEGRANAIELTGDDNRLELWKGSTITGNVMVSGGGSNNVLALGGADDFEFDVGALGETGQYQGFTAFEKTGDSTSTLTGTTTEAAPWTVTQGKLVVGDDAHPETTVAGPVNVTGGTLAGIGKIGGLNVGAGGTVAPGTGSTIGTLTVTGNVAFAADSTLQVRANASGQADQIVATGPATLSGGTVAVLPQGTGFLPQTTYTILKAGGGVSGTFSGANTTSNFAFLTPTLSYDANEVHLTLALTEEPGSGGDGSGTGGNGTGGNGSGDGGDESGTGGSSGAGGGGGKPIAFSSVALTSNQAHVADAVQALALGHPLYNAVVGQTVEGARQAFAALSGEAHASALAVMLGGGSNVQSAVADRLRQGLSGAAGAVAALGEAGPALAYARPSAAREAAAKSPLATMTTRVAPPPYVLWGEGFGGWGRRGGNAEAAGLDTSVGGFALGADVPLGDSVRVGAAGGYSRTSVDGRSGSSADLDSYYAMLYGGGQWGPLGLRLGAAYGWHDLAMKRSVVFPGFAETLESDRDANTLEASGELGYRVALGALALEPFAGLAHVRLETKAFHEDGGAAALSGLGGNDNVTFTNIGLRATHRWELSEDTALTLRGMVGWQRAFGDRTPKEIFIFAGGSQPFSASGLPIAKDALLLKAGAEFDISADVSFGVTYSAQLAKNAQDQQIKGLLSIRF